MTHFVINNWVYFEVKIISIKQSSIGGFFQKHVSPPIDHEQVIDHPTGKNFTLKISTFYLYLYLNIYN